MIGHESASGDEGAAAAWGLTPIVGYAVVSASYVNEVARRPGWEAIPGTNQRAAEVGADDVRCVMA